MSDIITLLECYESYAFVTKRYKQKKDGRIKKASFNSGELYKAYPIPLSSLDDIEVVINKIKTYPKFCGIRGKLISKGEPPYYRRSRKAPFDFASAKHQWVMCDLDDVKYPSDMDILNDQEEVIQWAKLQLPKPFHDRETVYQLSSGQNMTDHIDKKPEKLLKAHLWFWLDKEYSDLELKTYFKKENAPVDLALFQPVQIHYTCNPHFVGMEDPFKERVGRC